ncbi:hypothetical protein [Coleofasciculus chthonoplastes]|uniref:hypothetical protein n=1 Tax=Coleofasciculus chthonoplastes TaxID=64178 RepID=UPI00406474D7
MANDNLNSNLEWATLKLLRQHLSMTQEELAQELGTTSRTIRRQGNHRSISTSTLPSFSSLYDRKLTNIPQPITESAKPESFRMLKFPSLDGKVRLNV